MPPNKINLGMALYGRTWTLASSESNAMGSPATGPGNAGKVSTILLLSYCLLIFYTGLIF